MCICAFIFTTLDGPILLVLRSITHLCMQLTQTYWNVWQLLHVLDISVGSGGRRLGEGKS